MTCIINTLLSKPGYCLDDAKYCLVIYLTFKVIGQQWQGLQTN